LYTFSDFFGSYQKCWISCNILFPTRANTNNCQESRSLEIVLLFWWIRCFDSSTDFIFFSQFFSTAFLSCFVNLTFFPTLDDWRCSKFCLLWELNRHLFLLSECLSWIWKPTWISLNCVWFFIRKTNLAPFVIWKYTFVPDGVLVAAYMEPFLALNWMLIRILIWRYCFYSCRWCIEVMLERRNLIKKTKKTDLPTIKNIDFVVFFLKKIL
jgi:hypothetical protein